MKKGYIALGAAIAVTSLAVMSLGAYLKYQVLQPLGLGQEYNIVEIPFVLMTDDGLLYAVEEARNPDDQQTQPDTQATTVETTEATTQTTAEPTTELTTAPTTAPTEPSTVPPQTEPSKPTPPPTDPPQTQPPQTDPPQTQPPQTDPPTTPETTPETSQPTTPEVKPSTYPGYDFSVGAVPTSWFDDVLFIGDSRTVGLRDYARSGNADYFCSVGMTVFKVQKEACSDKDFSSQTLQSLLSSRSYGKIIISLGINECGYSTGSIISAYQDLIGLIRQLQPNAKIVLQSIMTVTEKYANGRSYFQPDHINSISERIRGLSDGATIFYIDVNAYFADSRGFLYTNITSDGCHLSGKYCKEWADWIAFAVGKLGI